MENLPQGAHWEPLSAHCRALVSRAHRFSTDTILLAHFAAPRRGERCADFGTGCGVIPLLWQSRYAPRAVTGVELNDEAVRLARAAVAENGFSDTVRIELGDIRRIRAIFPEPALDLVACNPPYKAVGAGMHCPDGSRAIARHEFACTLEDVARAGRDVLRFGGRMCICQRPERLTDALCTLRENGLEPKRLQMVQQRKNAAPSLFLLEARRGGKPGLSVLPALFIEAENGGFSPEMLEIYGDYKTWRENGHGGE